MKQWLQRFVEQINSEWQESSATKSEAAPEIAIDRATLLYITDCYNKYLIDTDTHPLRKARQVLDEFARELVGQAHEAHQEGEANQQLMFRLRNFFASHRLAEHTYVLKSFDDFKTIIWTFVDQLSLSVADEKEADHEMHLSLGKLREAAEADSIHDLRLQSRAFIDFYLAHQAKRNEQRGRRLQSMKKNLALVKKQLVRASHENSTDHLTGLHNRRSFEGRIQEQIKMLEFEGGTASLLALDIDHFKKINDRFGHDVGDFVLKEFSRLLTEIFHRELDFVARMGGEEFVVLLADHNEEQASLRADQVIARVRKEVFVQMGQEIRYRVSVGVAQWQGGEGAAHWLKQADEALYHAKNSGRDRFSVAQRGRLAG